jgi:hypothetical protein
MLKAGGAFCVSERGNLHVFKFDDFNGNGTQDAGEGPVAGVLIQVGPVPGSLCPSDAAGQLTGIDGWARWNGVAIGTYVVTETVPLGREATLPISRTLDIGIGATTVITFANRLPPSRIEGLVWHDKDADGGVDPDEAGLPNITIRLFADQDGNGIIDGTDAQIEQTSTDASGSCVFPLVRAGDYVVVVDQADADLPVGLLPLGSASVPVSDLTPGATATVNFRFDDSGQMIGHVWHDSDGDATPELGEIDLAGIQVCLFGDSDGDGQLDGSDPLLGCLNSNAAGNTLFTGLAGGDYLLEVDENDPDLPAGYKLTVANPQGYALPPGATQVLHFGFWQPPTPTPTPTATSTPTPIPSNGCIIGRKVDVLQVGLPGWTIHARPRDEEQPVLTAVTDGSGDFFFVGLREGWWTVWEEMQPGWTAVTPAMLDIEVRGTPPCMAVSFRNRLACAIDSYEPDNSVAAAAPLFPNDAGQRHTLEPPTDQDYVRFEVMAGAIYTLQTDNLVGSTDTLLILYDRDGTTILAANDDIVTGSDPRSRIVWTAPAGGVYFARVRDYYQDGARDCLGYDLLLIAEFRNYLPLLLAPPPPPPPPSPTPTPTVTPTATPTRTPVPTLPPITVQA